MITAPCIQMVSPSHTNHTVCPGSMAPSIPSSNTTGTGCDASIPLYIPTLHLFYPHVQWPVLELQVWLCTDAFHLTASYNIQYTKYNTIYNIQYTFICISISMCGYRTLGKALGHFTSSQSKLGLLLEFRDNIPSIIQFSCRLQNLNFRKIFTKN